MCFCYHNCKARYIYSNNRVSGRSPGNVLAITAFAGYLSNHGAANEAETRATADMEISGQQTASFINFNILTKKTYGLSL